MTTSADRILGRGLTAYSEGLDLRTALGTSVDEEVRLRHAVSGLRRSPSPWTTWHTRLNSTFGFDQNRIREECFRWSMVTDAHRSSEPVQAVARHLGAGHQAIPAVERVLVDMQVSALEQRWCALGHRLYAPEQVAPFLLPHLVPSFATLEHRLISLARWVNDQLTWVSDTRKWGTPDAWQAPAHTLAYGTGDCEDFALVLWSAAPHLGLPHGQLVIGTWNGDGHAWVDFPELATPLVADGVSGQVLTRQDAGAAGYHPTFVITPTSCMRVSAA